MSTQIYIIFFHGHVKEYVVQKSFVMEQSRRDLKKCVCCSGWYMQNSIKNGVKHNFCASGCGGLIISDLGVISSPNWPIDYPPNTECYWEVVSTLGSNISLTFDSLFGFANTADCGEDTGDYLEVRVKTKYELWIVSHKDFSMSHFSQLLLFSNNVLRCNSLRGLQSTNHR